MFEFGRELKRLFHADGPREGLTGGDASLLELLDMDLLRTEARAADLAVNRSALKARPRRQLEAAVVWREIARRTGDAGALCKAASCAELAANGLAAGARRRIGYARDGRGPVAPDRRRPPSRSDAARPIDRTEPNRTGRSTLFYPERPSVP